MSGRRPQPDRPSVPGSKTIRVVCTDKGQHSEVSFGSVVVWPDGDGWHVHLRLSHRGREYVDLEPVHRDQLLPERLHKTYPLKCRRCGRDAPLRADTLEKIFSALADADMPKLDLSDLS